MTISPPTTDFRRRLRIGLIAFAACLACGMLHGLHVRYGFWLHTPFNYPRTPMVSIWLVLAWFTWRYLVLAALIPLFAWIVRRYPPGPDWATNSRAFLAYLCAAPLLSSLSLILAAVAFHIPHLNPPDAMRFDMTARELLSYMWFQHLFFCMVILAALAVCEYQALLRERERLAATLRTQTVEARLQALQHQLQPHFLFNSLHAVSALIGRRPEQAVEMVGRIAGFLQLVLDRGGAVQGPLAAELTLLERYLSIESVRFSDRLRVEMNIDPAARDCLVPTLLLQPLAENAIRHGISRRAEPGTLRISAQVEGECLRLEVEDDGPGPSGRCEAGHGTGLSNTRERLAAWCGDEPFELALRSGPAGGTCVRIALPARHQPAPTADPAPPSPALEPAFA